MTDSDKSNDTGSNNDKWYVNTRTGEITQGIRREWGTRLGPYPSAEAASHWRDSIARHNAEADAEDMRDQQYTAGHAYLQRLLLHYDGQ